ncbi:20911_t:CDS:2 [Cetraspora pellucida]|uniref:20911_t:CDS:1 n=1 Tax=Cetraspora pellucida TaxID=1433469 RepID=A0A9N9AZA1_9GLOM|nr:20911_t:CDS:2 [Cetraspora pellucida]
MPPKIAWNKKIRECRESQTLEEQFNKQLDCRRKDKSSHCNLLCFEQRHVIDDMIHACHYCGARFWLEEKSSGNKTCPIFTTCCNKVSMVLPSMHLPPDVLIQLLTSLTSESQEFHKNIRAYNSAFAFSFLGIYNFHIHGELYHSIGGLLPSDSSEHPCFAQLYIYDTDHETQNRLNIMPSLNPIIIEELAQMLNLVNPYVLIFRQVCDIYVSNPTILLKLIIKVNGSKDPRRYNAPTASEVAAIIISNENTNALLTTEIRDGYTNEACSKTITQRQYFAYLLQWHPLISHALHYTGRFFQQFIVDAYVTIEQSRLNWVSQNQIQIRAELYQGLQDAVANTDGNMQCSMISQHIVLPASFTADEKYFLHMLLNIIKGATSFENLRTINRIIYNTFKEACDALELLQNDNE